MPMGDFASSTHEGLTSGNPRSRPGQQDGELVSYATALTTFSELVYMALAQRRHPCFPIPAQLDFTPDGAASKRAGLSALCPSSQEAARVPPCTFFYFLAGFQKNELGP